MDATKTLWTSFVDGFTGGGIFGDLRLPGAPIKMFRSEPQAGPILVLRAEPGVEIRPEEIVRLQAAVQRAVNDAVGERVVVTIPPPCC
jgi:hypothetical protein